MINDFKTACHVALRHQGILAGFENSSRAGSGVRYCVFLGCGEGSIVFNLRHIVDIKTEISYFHANFNLRLLSVTPDLGKTM